MLVYEVDIHNYSDTFLQYTNQPMYPNPNPNIVDPLDSLERGEVSPSFVIDMSNGAAFLAITGRAPTGTENFQPIPVPQLQRQTNDPTVFPARM